MGLLIDIDTSCYESQLRDKRTKLEALLAPYSCPPVTVFPSPPTGYRMRAEFRLWHQGDDLFYAMFEPAEPRTPVRVDHFPVASERIQAAMPRLLEAVRDKAELRRKWFQVEFLSTLSGELLITMIYHRPLGPEWEQAARTLEALLDARLIGRSRKQRVVLSDDYVTETLEVKGKSFSYRQYEQGFTQPNARVNQAMLSWACDCAAALDGDLL